MGTSWAGPRADKTLGKSYDGQGQAADGSTLRFDRGVSPDRCPICLAEKKAKEQANGK